MQTKLPKGALSNGAIVGGIGTCLVLVVVGGLRLVAPSQARPGDGIRTKKLGYLEQLAQIGNCNNFGTNSGTMNCGTVNVGPQPRRLDSPQAEHLKEQILAFPREKSYVVSTIFGDQEAFQLATQILAFMQAHDFKVRGVRQVIYDKPIVGLAKQDLPSGEIDIMVGSRK